MNGLPFQNGPEMAITYFKENRGGGQAAGGGGGRGGHEGGGVGRGGIAAAAGARRTRGGGHPGQGQATGGGGGGINRYPLGNNFAFASNPTDSFSSLHFSNATLYALSLGSRVRTLI